MDKVSIIVPVFNTDKYLSRCINSILCQTYESLEAIFVDDGSWDESARIIDEFCAKDSRIVAIHQDNQGPSGARNSGLAAATGDYILFVDSDDFITEDYVERLVNEQHRSYADIVMCNYDFVDDTGKIVENSNHTVYYREGCFEGTEALRLFENRSYKTFFDILWNKLYRRELFDDIRFPEGISVVEDIAVLPLLYHKAQRITVIKDSIYRYTYRDNSLAHTKRSVEEDTHIRVPMMQARLKMYQDWQIKDLVLVHMIHMYSLYDRLRKEYQKELKGLQKEYRKAYFCGRFASSISASRQLKFLCSFISLRLYNRLVEMR